ncbi:MAG: caspase family protein [Thermodesulfovibrionales bacterium]|nr:caspase family protein [Thermodesulfovibrionales bacterium]
MFDFEKRGVIHAKNAVGMGNEELLTKGLSALFNKVDIYKDITEIRNKGDYDYILIPDFKIVTSYDRKEALERGVRLYPLHIIKGDPIWISASTEYQIEVRDAKNNHIASFTGKGESKSSSSEAYCSKGSGFNLSISGDYLAPIGKAMSSAFNELLRTAEHKFTQLAKTKSEERALPSDLALNIRFSDSSGFLPNNSLDAGENAEIIVIVKNTGKGSGYGTNLEISSDNPRITFDKNITIGDIQPSETKEIKIPLKAGLDIADGKAAFQFNLKEKRGYDAKKVAMYVPTARLERPQLEIISTEINDGDTGLAKGNGNGIIESGETIELTAFIKNSGAGKAIGVNLNTADTISGIQWVRDSILVGTIPQGEIVKAKVAFTVPRNFDAKEISTNLKVGDIRGVNNAEKKAVFVFAKRSPNIQYAYRIYSKGNQVNSITNGESYELELTLNNSGQIPARKVFVNLTSNSGLSLSSSRIEIGDLKEQTSAPKQTINISVPRTFVEAKVPLNITIAQSDFSSVADIIQIPVDVKSPKLAYKTNLLSKSGGGSIEKGEQAILELYVVNDGNLPAEGVKIKIESRDENLKLIGQTEALIGKIPANAKSETVKFQLSTLRRIKVGDAYIGVTVTQNDFSPLVSQYALNIREEGVSVVDVSDEEKTKVSTVAKTQSGPVILLKAPQSNESTGDESIRLAFEVSDSRSVESIKVTLNGSVVLDEKPTLRKKGVVKNISLKEGENRIVITAYNADNISAKKEITVTRIAEDDVDTPPVTAMRNPNAVAVVIGISKFENKDIQGVDFARRDAMAMKEYLVKTLGYNEANITEFYDENAELTKLKSFFNTRLKNKIKRGVSDVFVFYSGHGVPDTNSGEPYFVPYNYDPRDIKTTGYSVKEFYKQLESLKAKSVTVVVDACYQGFTGDDRPKPIIKDASPVTFEVTNPLLTIKNGVVFTASSGKQVASWYRKKQHGIFTYYFLQGLGGRADADGNGQITVGELKDYLMKNVPEQARILYNDREQMPEIVGDKDAVMVKLK